MSTQLSLIMIEKRLYRQSVPDLLEGLVPQTIHNSNFTYVGNYHKYVSSSYYSVYFDCTLQVEKD